MENKLDEIIKDHVITAMAAGAIPVPVADLAAVSAVHLSLIKKISVEMDKGYNEMKGKALISSLITGTVTRTGASLIKLLPGIGTIAGITTQILFSGATTYAIGKVLVSAYDRGETIDSISGETVKGEFDKLVKKGKKYASSLKKTEDYKGKVKENEAGDFSERKGETESSDSSNEDSGDVKHQV